MPSGVDKGKVSVCETWAEIISSLPRDTAHWGETSCLRWDRACGRGGYGMTRFEGKSTRAHRMTFKMFHGRFPNGLACHHCDHPWCVNPLHLFEGSPAENAADSVAKGRKPRGISSPGHINRKIDPNRVRDLLRFDFSQQEIAEWFGITRQHVSLIYTGKFRGLDA